MPIGWSSSQWSPDRIHVGFIEDQSNWQEPFSDATSFLRSASVTPVGASSPVSPPAAATWASRGHQYGGRLNIYTLGQWPVSPPSDHDSSDRMAFNTMLWRRVSGSWSLVHNQTTLLAYSSSGLWSISRNIPLVEGSEYYLLIQGWTQSSRWTGQRQVQKPLGVRFYSQRDPDTQPVIDGLPQQTFHPYIPGYSFNLTWGGTDVDPDNENSGVTQLDYNGFEIQLRNAPTVAVPNPAWTTVAQMIANGELNTAPNDLSTAFRLAIIRVGSTLSTLPQLRSRVVNIPSPGSYEVRIRTQDRRNAIAWPDTSQQRFIYTAHGRWSPWSDALRFTFTENSLPPLLVSPVDNRAETIDRIDFSWRYRDPRSTGGAQKRREVRLRRVGDTAWTTVIPSGEQASSQESYEWTPPDGLLVPGQRYEWQARTTSNPGDYVSDWSESGFFYAVPVPGSGGEIDPSPDGHPVGLGCGEHRVFLFARGGEQMLGEITAISSLRWHRRRNDISKATIHIEEWDEDCGALLSSVRPWMHEIVIYRAANGRSERVWEGPVTRAQWEVEKVTIEATDVLAYPYRRIMRQGYNDTWTQGGAGNTSVAARALSILQNCLAYDDPNVLGYVTAYVGDSDARQSRTVVGYSCTAYEEIDDLAATAGLQYTAVGRRIILAATKEGFGRLPELRDEDFDGGVECLEDGMQLANVYATSNNNGVYGMADRLVDGLPEYYGFIEMVDSTYGETEGSAIDEALTEEAKAELRAALSSQSEVAIENRYPTPIIVSTARGGTLSPDVEVGINQLVPGTVVPVRVGEGFREVVQMCVIDALDVVQNEDGDEVSVSFSPVNGVADNVG